MWNTTLHAALITRNTEAVVADIQSLIYDNTADFLLVVFDAPKTFFDSDGRLCNKL